MNKSKPIISFNIDKIKQKYNTLDFCKEHCSLTLCEEMNIAENIDCMQEKWNFYNDAWEKYGFDSTCGFHCCQFKLCMKIFKDKECTNITYKEGE